MTAPPKPNVRRIRLDTARLVLSLPIDVTDLEPEVLLCDRDNLVKLGDVHIASRSIQNFL